MKRLVLLRTLLASLLLLLAAGAAPAEIWFVSPAGDDIDAGNRPTRPFLTICKAVQESRSTPEGDEIRVAEGTYLGPGNMLVPDPADVWDTRTGCALIADSGSPQIQLLGGWRDDFTDRDPSRFVSIIDGEAQSRLIVIGQPGAAASEITVDGFTLQNGLAPDSLTDPLNTQPIDTPDYIPAGAGGGVLVLHSSAVITNNIIRNNATSGPASHGGGMAVWVFPELDDGGGPVPEFPGVAPGALDVSILANDIAYNTVIGYGGGVALYDALVWDPVNFRNAMRSDTSAPVLRNNTIHHNEARDDPDSAALGGGVWIGGNRTMLEGNFIESNLSYGAFTTQTGQGFCTGSQGQSTGCGGGIGLRVAAPVITNNQILQNTSQIQDGNICRFAAQGGGAYMNSFYGTFRGNLVADNNAIGATGLVGNQGRWQAGGGGLNITFAGSLPSLAPMSVTNNTILGNTTSGNAREGGTGGGVYLYDFGGEMEGNTITANTAARRGGGLGVTQKGFEIAFPAAGVLTDNRVEGNIATERAGGIFLRVGDIAPTTTLEHTRVLGNEVTDPLGDGAGLQISGEPVITNIEISGNLGDGLYMTDFVEGLTYLNAPLIENATITGNTGYGLLQRGVAPGAALVNTILRGNGTEALDQTSGLPFSVNLDVEFCNVEGFSPPDQGNIDADPLFVAGTEGPYYLSQPLADAVQTDLSPSVDAGASTPDLFGLGFPWVTRTDGGTDWCMVDQGYHARVRVDTDGDTWYDDVDNCPDLSNPDQADTSGDGIGDACKTGDDDVDGDTVLDDVDNCQWVPNGASGDNQADQDGDTVGDACDPDLDGDGAPNDDETALSLLPDTEDTDGDTLPDGAAPCECRLDDSDNDGAINALDCDSDGDTIPDTIEAGLDAPGGPICPAATDADPSSRTSTCNPDTDGGGEWDGFEDANQDGRVDPGENDPNNPDDDDTDGDRLSNLEETNTYGTDPLDADTDDDGLTDGAEVLDWGTNPLDCDTDDDGLHDGTELGLEDGTDPTVLDPVCIPERDYNGNGCEDEGTDPAATCMNVVSGQDEPAYRPDADPASSTNPVVRDTDGDGCPDGTEDANQNGNFDGRPGESEAHIFNQPADLALDCAFPQAPEIDQGTMERVVTGPGTATVQIEFDPTFNGSWYRLYRGTLASLATGAYDHAVADNAGNCWLEDGPAPLTIQDMDPLAGTYVDGTANYYYLLAAENGISASQTTLMSNMGFARSPSGFLSRRPCNQGQCTCTTPPPSADPWGVCPSPTQPECP